MSDHPMGISYRKMKDTEIQERMFLQHMFLPQHSHNDDYFHNEKGPYYSHGSDEVWISETHYYYIFEYILVDDPSVIRKGKRLLKARG